jgi:hypothetical protein
MRFAAPDKIATAEDVVLFDDLVKDGRYDDKSTQVTALRMFTRSHVALLLLQTPRGVYALKIDASGKVAPMTARVD